MINYMIFPQRLGVLAQVTLEMIAPDKTMLLKLSAETIVYISSKINMCNKFRNWLKREGAN